MSKDNNEIQNPEEMIKKISKQLYNDEYFIEKAIYTEKAQQNKTFTFFRDDTKNDIQKYCWCQRPCDGAYLDSEEGYDKNIKYWFININTLEDLLLLVKNIEEEVIISENVDGNYSLEIYNNWRE